MSDAPFVPLESPLTPPRPVPGSEAVDWMLDPGVTYLNHGCFGARMRPVHEAHARWTSEFESRPVEVLDRRRDDLIDGAKDRIGVFLGMRPDAFGFVTNATGGVNAVLRSLTLTPGDELLTTNHVYNAVRQTMRHVAAEHGAVYREIPVELPVRSPHEIEERIVSAVGPRTRLLVIDHVTSPTATIIPVERIVTRCRVLGVDVLVDGAHAPGMLPLDVEAIGATYYTGNLHKWVCAPVGAAFLWVNDERRDVVHPNTISHFLGEGFTREFAWQGTRDIGPWLCAVDSIAALDALGWDRVRDHNHRLAVWAQSLLASAWDVEPLGPVDGTMLGSMAGLPLPEFACGLGPPDDLPRLLYDRFRIEVPVFEWNDRPIIRVSCQLYNRPEQYERLATAMREVAALTESP